MLTHEEVRELSQRLKQLHLDAESAYYATPETDPTDKVLVEELIENVLELKDYCTSSSEALIDLEAVKALPLTCEVCGQTSYSVEKDVVCGYHLELEGIEVLETICPECEHQHLLDV